MPKCSSEPLPARLAPGVEVLSVDENKGFGLTCFTLYFCSYDACPKQLCFFLLGQIMALYTCFFLPSSSFFIAGSAMEILTRHALYMAFIFDTAVYLCVSKEVDFCFSADCLMNSSLLVVVTSAE